ncbi:hypothetical protein UVI_02061280 [Ustilaginoidea virens]|uniref:protein O-GlcNAc transferase n=1 Tax=Ustilaginoidea virens TaxID=1159556 RepID=A0A1B5L9C2_USTVR|nr:hypothetical protein UVI_02061280 [Ustilaginoidea virens]
MGAALYCLNRQAEAEQSWLKAVKLQPCHLDATEHLVAHLYKNRGGEAVEVISSVQKALRLTTQEMACGDAERITSESRTDKVPIQSSNAGAGLSHSNKCQEVDSAGFGSSGYMLPGLKNGRILALVHAKGTILYGRRDVQRAAEAFQEAVLISIGRQVTNIQELICRIQYALTAQDGQQIAEGNRTHTPALPMLPPEKARHTSRLVFGSSGELPGLVFLRNSLSKRAAVQTTSNSLLSLAKILQDSMSSGSSNSYLFRGSSQVGDILSLYYLSLSLQESPSTANNVGILLAGIQQLPATSSLEATRVSSQTQIPGINPGSGLALALSYYNYGLRLDPNHVHLHTNLGSLLKDVGQLDLAIQMYERAVSCDGRFDIALTNLANAIKDKGRINDAILYYRRAVHANPEFAEAVCGLFTALNSVCNWHGRGGVLLESGRFDRWHVDANGGLVDVQASERGSGLTQRVVEIVTQQLRDACHWGLGVLHDSAISGLMEQLQHLCKDPSFKLDEALHEWAGKPWEGSRLVRLIERAAKVMQRNWMQSSFGLHDTKRVRAICYATTASDGSVHRLQIEKEAPVFRDVSSWSPDRLLGQISRDNVHILVNLNGYTRGARNEIFAARPAPIQMSFMGFAGTLGAEWCDYILADKTAVPATTLRPWRDNISIEDLFCDDNEGMKGDWMYSENVIFCRDTFFCCDHAQSCASGENGITWDEVERKRWEMRKELFPALEDDAIILGNFNQLYKKGGSGMLTERIQIDPTTFRSWLRILSRAPRAVLWLLRFPEPGESNLRATARAWAGSEVANRIFFTDVAPKSQHISRARVCDLFLDTPECNAHTTAADVLWSSTPLLTLPRYAYKMCSRMAASILRGALPRSVEGEQIAAELIASSEEEYEQRAVALANGATYTANGTGYAQAKGRLASIRRLLWDNKWQCGLFDTQRWVNDLEMAYEEAWRRWVNGTGGDIFL